jgi:hypothetical protein
MMDAGYKMRKANRVVYVDKGRVPAMLAQGYDHVGPGGVIIQRATGGRAVSLEQYHKVEDERDELKKELELLRLQMKEAKDEQIPDKDKEERERTKGVKKGK